MKITISMLFDKRVCREGEEWFILTFPTREADHEEILSKLEEQKTTTEYGKWLLTRFPINGVYKIFHSNGQLFEAYEYVNMKKNGLYQSWYFNGQLRAKCEYINDKRAGPFKMWHDNGKEYVQNEKI